MKGTSGQHLRAIGTALILLAAGGLAFGELHAQERVPLWVHLKPSAGVPSTASPTELGITEQALKRRAKVLPPDQLIDVHDVPVPSSILEQIRSTGARIRTASRWLNAVSVEATSVEGQLLKSLPAVERMGPVAVYRRRIVEPSYVAGSTPLGRRSEISGFDYGSSYTQLNVINVIPLHDAGIVGGGIIVGMVDDGYNTHRLHDATANNRVLAEYDFVQGDTNTSIEAGETPGQGNHGMYTYSALAGFKQGSLIGPAFGSAFLLAKTEVIGSETQIEEDLYVQGLEWLEQQGADLVSSSLGYIDWYNYSQLDGNTAVTTKAARIATRKGVLLVTAMGNESWYQYAGGPTGTMIAPADADSIIAVGAVTSSAVLASFSSTGPTADGRTKPEVVAQGVSVVSASPSSPTGYVTVNGTSLSTPLAAGVAALVLSAHPNLTPVQVRQAIMATAVQIDDGTAKTAFYPNNFYGSGLVNALDAVLYHGPAFSNTPTVVDRGTVIDVVTSILSNTALTGDSLALHFQRNPGDTFERVQLYPTGIPNQYVGSIVKGPTSISPRGFFSAYTVPGGRFTSPYGAPESLFVFSTFATPVSPDETPSTFELFANYPNPFNAGTRIVFDAPYAAHVELSIYTLLGQRVVTLMNGTALQGRTELSWDGRDASGVPVPSGVYFYGLSTPQGSQTRRLMILK